ncbi:phage coat protein [Clostridium beijerinckii]|uniref:phage coat protein n=1 Tax=Clostridium beijerinckii TaxID=1520 RepID=UPI001360C9B5|nr:phage coat protein [Clostridium beijerinckii]MZK53649.1 phage coat protein [Clostridium beijerinckii]MZK61760.1 phage coat protein [Clostridium beijerinckii]MZK71959.1 phage coat protein [Clostridium beijerinckii]MZK77346.1 phage coat protein [Clostridium beijerinckii]MZK86930.1 phage coat protein [Clostridium beijerinckii]
MPSIFNEKIFNGEVFGQYVDRVPNLTQNQLIKSQAIKERNDLKAQFAAQSGSNFISVPLKGLIGGDAQNYDGKTDMVPSSTKTFLHSRIVVGRMKSWVEDDFSTDITGGVDFMANIADQVATYWQGIDQKTMISVFKGCFNMSGTENLKFVKNHTVDVTSDATNGGNIGATTINTAMQKALGDNKKAFSLVLMHSVVATNLENLKLLEYMKYTDAQGIERNLDIGTIHGRTVLVDDGMPSKEVYVKCASSDAGALKVVASGATDGQINLADVTPTLNTYTPAANDYVKLGTAYTSYILGTGAVEFTNAGAKVPYEGKRDPYKNGGQDALFSRQRKCFAPYGISFKTPTIISPSDAQLEDGSNWELVNTQDENTGDREYINHRSIPIAQLISLG